MKGSASPPPGSTFHHSNVDNKTTSPYRRVNETLREAVEQGDGGSVVYTKAPIMKAEGVLETNTPDTENLEAR